MVAAMDHIKGFSYHSPDVEVVFGFIKNSTASNNIFSYNF